MSEDPFVSYAQNHEDVVLARALRPDEGIGFWIDVGAGDPLLDSVTAAFSERGWRGVNVEPLAREHELLCAARPDDVNLRVALGAAPGYTKLFEGPAENRGSSTIRPEIAERYIAEGQDFTTSEVSVTTLAEVVDLHAEGTVDFLKVDVEGSEFDVLAGTDWSNFHPRIVVVEATAPNSTEPTHRSWEPMLLEAGYCLALFDGLNRFYASAQEASLGERLAVPANVLDHYVPYVLSEQIKELNRYVETFEAERERLACEAAGLGAELASLTGEHERMAESLQSEVARLARELGDARRAVACALDRAETADETAAIVRQDLAVAQFQAARALTRAQVFHDEVAALHATRTLRYTARLRSMYGKLRRFGVW